MLAAPSSSSPAPAAPRNPWPRVATLLGLAAILALAAIWLLQRMTSLPATTLDKGVTLVKAMGEQAVTVAQAFHQQSVRQEFLSSAATLTGTKRLEVAKLNEHETFRRKESDSVAWGMIPLPSIVVQADVPVEYGFYLDFDGPWEFAQTDDEVVAYPPAIQPNTPAADVSKLTFYTLEGHIWQDDKAVRDRLQGSLSVALRERAGEHVPLVREIARRQVQSFVEKWLADSFSDGGKFHVKVVFPEERIRRLSDAPGITPKPAN